MGTMTRSIIFTIKETPTSRPFTLESSIDVCKNWDELSQDDKREFLITPRFSVENLGKTRRSASRFQEVFPDPVYDFEFAEIRWPNDDYHREIASQRAIHNSLVYY